MQLKPGTLLQGGKYKIVRFIKSGGFGCTYEALHTVFGNRVAIKEFFPKDFCNRDADTLHVTVGTQSKAALVAKLKAKFIDEAVAIHNLSHVGIVKVSDVFEENCTAYYVMDYIDGCSLDEIVKREGALSEQNALGYIRQVCEALSYVHSQKRLHLDIKPGNIMIDASARAVLIDFGTSRQYDEESGENTSTLLPLTPGYAPTEQYRRDGMAQFTPVTDVYSLGATLYKLLTGVTPVDAPSRASGESLAPLPSCVSQSVSSAVQAAMSLDRVMRPQSVDEFMSLLEQPEVPVEGDDTIVIGSDKEEVVGPDDFHVDPVPDADKRNLKKWLWPLLACLAVEAVVSLAISRPFEPDDLSFDLYLYKEFLHLGDSLSMHDESLSESRSAYDSASFYEQKYSGSRYSHRFRGVASSKSAFVQSRIDSIRVSDSLAKIAAFEAAEVEAETISVSETDPLASQWENDLREYSSLMEKGDEYSKSDATLSQSKSKYEQALKFERKYVGTKYSDKFSKGASKSLKSVESRIKEKEEADAAAAARAETERLSKEQKAREESERKQKEEAERKREETSYTNGILRVKGVEYPMVYVSGGSFDMGATPEQGSEADPNEKPVHRVTLSSYSIGKYEVTQELWEAVMGSNPSYFKGSRRPVEEVSWFACRDFIRKLNKMTGANFRLPTEAEWEFAARGGNNSRGYKYSGSDTLDDVAWYGVNSGDETHDVGTTKSPNELGLYDMSGNVWERCSDRLGSYSRRSQTNPKGPDIGSDYVIRGGSWAIKNSFYCRISYRGFDSIDFRTGSVGFRLCH